jgi:tyrosyl-tRNA synthetase
MAEQDLIQDLGWRGMIQQMTADEELKQHLNSGMKVVYCGFDPTADSLHIGSLT